MLKVAVVGATGVVGQQFAVALGKHPWFEVTSLSASKRSAGRTYLEALKDERTGALRWFCKEAPPEGLLEMKVEDAAEANFSKVDLAFTAVEAEQALELEPSIAKSRPVVSTASAFRYEKDVPILVPGANLDHARLLEVQKRTRGWKGFVAPQPNCTTTGLVITLKPILDNFGLERVVMTSLQSVSGAGRSPGVLGLDIIDNVIPYIPREEEKVQTETLKVLGSYGQDAIKPAGFKVSCTCTRINVLEGHTEAVFLSTSKPCTPDQVAAAMRKHTGGFDRLGLPSAPGRLIVVHDDPFRPQPRLDRDNYDGMATTVGRIREDPALENGVKYVLLSHNTKMGAAKGAVLTAEYLLKEGFI